MRASTVSGLRTVNTSTRRVCPERFSRPTRWWSRIGFHGRSTWIRLEQLAWRSIPSPPASVETRNRTCPPVNRSAARSSPLMKVAESRPNRRSSRDRSRDWVALYSVKNSTDRPANGPSTSSRILLILVSSVTASAATSNSLSRGSSSSISRSWVDTATACSSRALTSSSSATISPRSWANWSWISRSASRPPVVRSSRPRTARRMAATERDANFCMAISTTHTLGT